MDTGKEIRHRTFHDPTHHVLISPEKSKEISRYNEIKTQKQKEKPRDTTSRGFSFFADEEIS